jgi:hypothetical protein
MVSADSEASPEEADRLAEVENALGKELFNQNLAEAQNRFGNFDEMKPLLQKITRQGARDLIYGSLLDVAITGTVEEGEEDILEWLEREWEVKAIVNQ